MNPHTAALQAKTPTVSYTSLLGESVRSNLYSILNGVSTVLVPSFGVSGDSQTLNSKNLMEAVKSFAKPSMHGDFEGGVSASLSSGAGSVDWDGFKDWLKARKFSEKYVANCLGYARRNASLFFSGRLSELQTVSGKKHALRGLSNLGKFLGCYGRFKSMVQESGLRWNDDDENAGWAFFEMWNSDVNGALDWLGEVREKLGFETWWVLAFQGLTGLRTSESINALNLVADGKLEDYLDRERMILQHFKHRDLFLRGGKKCFFSVVTDEIVKVLESWKVRFTYGKLEKRLKHKGISVRTYELRKYWATTMRKNNVQAEIIDLCQGRAPSSVFQRSYWRPDMAQVIETVKNVVKKMQNEIGIG